MKKIALFAGLLLATSAQAASINWNVTGLASKVLKDYTGSVAANQTVYLVLSDSTSLATITDLENPTAFETALAKITLDSASTTSEGKKPTVSGKVVTSDLLTAGTTYTFGILFTSTDADGNGFFKYISGTPVAAYTTGDTANATSVSTSFADLTSNTSWTKGYTAVPEPSTAALALAGLALLLKRRKA